MIEQHHVERVLGKNLERLPDASAMFHADSRIRFQRAGDALAKQRMVVNQQYAQELLIVYCHWKSCFLRATAQLQSSCRKAAARIASSRHKSAGWRARYTGRARRKWLLSEKV